MSDPFESNEALLALIKRGVREAFYERDEARRQELNDCRPAGMREITQGDVTRGLLMSVQIARLMPRISAKAWWFAGITAGGIFGLIALTSAEQIITTLKTKLGG